MKKHQFNGNKPTFRFTLIELLVVIAIIGILAALLLPALKMAKDTSRSVYCINNLKQTSLIVQQYINDYEGYIPPSFTNYGPSSYTCGWGRLFKELGYLKKYTILQCTAPTDTILPTNYQYGFTNYGFNKCAGITYFSFDPLYDLMRISQIKMPSKDGLIIDGKNAGGYPTVTPVGTGRVTGVDFRHPPATANVSFLDGHASTHSMLDPYFTTADPDYCTRWAIRKY